MSTSHQEASQIGTLVIQNFSLFQNAIARLDNDTENGALVNGELGRLKLWSGSLGAYRRPGFRSLDYRLRDASRIQKHVVSILLHLTESLKDVIELAATESTPHTVKIDDEADEDVRFQYEYLWGDSKSQQAELDQVLRDVVDGVDCLLRFSIAIRNPSSHDRNKAETLETSLSFYEEFDIRHVQEKFPKASEALANRLGRALTRRRQYFQYREKHHQHLSAGLDQELDLQHIQETEMTTIASSIPDHLKAENVPSDFKGIPEIDDTRSEMSCTSYASSTQDVEKLRVPPLPIEHEHGPFLCPLCHTVISVKTRPEWNTKHVFGDLRPYICLSNLCPASDQQFTRRHEWTQHNLESCPQSFDSRSSFLEHTQTVHANEISQNNLEPLERLCHKKDLEWLDRDCPLCEQDNIASIQQYESHVGRHLEDLALFALPKTGDANYSDTDDVKSEGSNESSSSLAVGDAIDRMQHEGDGKSPEEASRAISKAIEEARLRLFGPMVPPERSHEVEADLQTKERGNLSNMTLDPYASRKQAERKRRTNLQLPWDRLVLKTRNENASKGEIVTKDMLTKNINVLG
ncbi:hypothetical protein LCI18_003862 [Fusarium solani-melongenae]|uniref:Uncharacterized protein n=1 Tax=Fusarium solani subsp. cucurbitae TaxID=2747967 RepID=A0ACD3YVD9_FUSSC|nr:hypothetical protein LCI18_003862 [Fusarium solani-melongenae]